MVSPFEAEIAPALDAPLVHCAALGNPISTPRPVNDIAIEAYKLGQPSFSLLIAPCVRIQRLWCQHIKPRAFPRRLAS